MFTSIFSKLRSLYHQSVTAVVVRSLFSPQVPSVPRAKAGPAQRARIAAAGSAIVLAVSLLPGNHPVEVSKSCPYVLREVNADVPTIFKHSIYKNVSCVRINRPFFLNKGELRVTRTSEKNNLFSTRSHKIYPRPLFKV